MINRHSAVALAVAAALAAPAFAADVQPEVVVSASRFDDADSKAPVSLTRISREDIAKSGGVSLPDVLGLAAGIDVRPMSGALGIDTVVDLRGFGATQTLPVDATRGLRDFSDDVRSTLDTLGIGSAHLVGWSMGERMTRDLAIGALLMAVWRRSPKEKVIVHSDQGCQYSSHSYSCRSR